VKSRIIRQSSDVLHALGSAFLPKPLYADDDPSLEGPCTQLFLYATSMSASATGATTIWAGYQALCLMGDQTSCQQAQLEFDIMTFAISQAANAWAAYRAACTGGSRPLLPDSSTSSAGGGGGTVCWYRIYFYEDTNEVAYVSFLGCW
jgi:hypothetical protein